MVSFRGSRGVEEVEIPDTSSPNADEEDDGEKIKRMRIFRVRANNRNGDLLPSALLQLLY